MVEFPLEIDYKFIVHDVYWFFGKETIGVIIVENHGTRMAYIGTGEGLNEKADILSIAFHGTKVHYGQVNSIMESLKK